MSDPRLNGSHLSVARYDQYYAAVDDMLDDRGPLTAAADPLARRPAGPRRVVPRLRCPPGGTYALISLETGHRHQLRTGINAIGRFTENDLVLKQNCISRRHCVIT